MTGNFNVDWDMERVMGEAGQEKSPVDFFTAERPDSGCPGRCIKGQQCYGMDAIRNVWYVMERVMRMTTMDGGNTGNAGAIASATHVQIMPGSIYSEPVRMDRQQSQVSLWSG